MQADEGDWRREDATISLDTTCTNLKDCNWDEIWLRDNVTINITAPENLHNTANVHNRVFSERFSINYAYF